MSPYLGQGLAETYQPRIVDAAESSSKTNPGSRSGKSLGRGFLNQLIENDHGAKRDDKDSETSRKERAHTHSN